MSSLEYLIIPVIVVILSQGLKVFIETIKYKKINIERFFDGMGGMPSSHSALVSSLTTVIFIKDGVFSPIFSVSLIFSLVVIYDSMGIRYESGLQAKEINKAFNSHLKERLGHKPIETLVGVLFGVISSVILLKII